MVSAIDQKYENVRYDVTHDDSSTSCRANRPSGIQVIVKQACQLLVSFWHGGWA